MFGNSTVQKDMKLFKKDTGIQKAVPEEAEKILQSMSSIMTLFQSSYPLKVS